MFFPVITTTLPLILQDIIAVNLLLNWHHKMNCILCVQYEYLLWLLTWLFESDDISYMTVLCWFIILVIFNFFSFVCFSFSRLFGTIGSLLFDLRVQVCRQVNCGNQRIYAECKIRKIRLTNKLKVLKIFGSERKVCHKSLWNYIKHKVLSFQYFKLLFDHFW